MGTAQTGRWGDSVMLSSTSWIVLLSTIATFWAVYMFLLSLRPREESLDDKLKRFTTWQVVSPSKPGKGGIRALLAELGRLTPRRWTERLDRELARAGIPVTGGEFLVVMGLVLALFFLLGLMILQQPLGAVFVALIGGIIPYIWLQSKKKSRRRQFDNQLADALLIMANSLRSGFSMLQAMEMVSQEMPEPISHEFRVTLREMAYGTSTETALQHLAKRVDSPDLDLVVTAILIQRQVGGNLSEILLNIHATIQDRLRIQQEIKTLTAQGRTSGYIIAGLPFAVAGILLIINPEYLQVLISRPLGWALLAGGLTLQLIGFLFIRKIINIET